MRRGMILLEILLSIALFVGAGAFCLASTRSVLDSLDRGRRQAEALDLARSKLTELDAGLISITQLEAEWSGAVGSYAPDAQERLGADLPWRIEVDSAPTEYGDLSLVTLTVTEVSPSGDAGSGGRAPISVTLRQLINLREIEPQAVEPDDLLDGLPPPESTPESPGDASEGEP